MSEASGSKRRATVNMKATRFNLPPVESALIVGKKAPIGSRAMEKALAEMLPDAFIRIDVQHSVIESLIVRQAHLKRIPRDQLVGYLVEQCGSIMDDSEMLRVSLEIEIESSQELDL
ncbi:MAG: hypothetical protein AB7S26_04255 [Sandaracinaceae bacterium]